MYNDCSHDDYLNEKTLTLIAVFTRLQGLKNEKQNVFFISSLLNFTQCVVMIFTPPPTPLRPQSLPLKKKNFIKFSLCCPYIFGYVIFYRQVTSCQYALL